MLTNNSKISSFDSGSTKKTATMFGTRKCIKPLSNHVGDENFDWLLAAVRRIRDQKQKANINRILNTLRHICPGRFSSRYLVQEQLEKAVIDGVIVRVGAPDDDCSYRDPGRIVRLKSHALRIENGVDLTKLVIRAARDLADDSGSTQQDLLRYIKSSYSVENVDNCNLESLVSKGCQTAINNGRMVLVQGEIDRYRAVLKEGSNSKAKTPLSSHELIDRAFTTQVCMVCKS